MWSIVEYVEEEEDLLHLFASKYGLCVVACGRMLVVVSISSSYRARPSKSIT